jgi:serine/threonine protein kinase
MSSHQKGGSKLGEGLYGCVFSPPLKCKFRTKKPGANSVGKLTELEEATTELMITKALENIQDAKDYFILIESVCEPAPIKDQDEPEIDDCKLLKSVDIEFSKLRQLTMRLGGQALTYTPWTTKDIDYYPLGQHLLEAGTLMLIAGIVHSDLHTSNILLDNPSKPKIIDFGIGWRPEAIVLGNMYEDVLRAFNTSISQESPELAVINGIIEGRKIGEILEQLQRNKVIVAQVGVLFEKSPSEMWAEFKFFLDHSRTYQDRSETALFNFFKIYWSKFDAWSIGIILFGLFAKLIHDPAFEKSLDYQTHGAKFVECIKGLCSLDPGLRMDCAEALQIWAPQSPVLERPEVKAWLAEAVNTREALARIL